MYDVNAEAFFVSVVNKINKLFFIIKKNNVRFSILIFKMIQYSAAYSMCSIDCSRFSIQISRPYEHHHTAVLRLQSGSHGNRTLRYEIRVRN